MIIDLHAHILPGVDDGARTIEESVELLRKAADQGIEAVIATPHFSRKAGRSEYETLLAQIRRATEKELPGFQLYLGQELFYHPDLVDRLLAGQALSLADSSYILVEFDEAVLFSSLYRGIRELSEYGYTPILAHMERYGCLREDDKLRELKSAGCLFQMNYESLAGRWYQRDVRWCRRQIMEKNIYVLGTDMHRMDYRPPEITGAVRWLERHVEEGYRRKLMGGRAGRILQDGFLRQQKEKE